MYMRAYPQISKHSNKTPSEDGIFALNMKLGFRAKLIKTLQFFVGWMKEFSYVCYLKAEHMLAAEKKIWRRRNTRKKVQRRWRLKQNYWELRDFVKNEVKFFVIIAVCLSTTCCILSLILIIHFSAHYYC